MMQAAGTEYPQIWHMFAFQPRGHQPPGALHAGDHARAGAVDPRAARADCGLHVVSQRLSVLTEVARRGRGGTVGAGERHAGRWRRVRRGRARDLESSALDEKDKALLRFVDKVNHDSPQITPQDMQPLYEAGWDDEAIYFAITVCALFNFYNRWIDASGVHALSRTKRTGRAASGRRAGLCQKVSAVMIEDETALGLSRLAGRRRFRGGRLRQLWRRCWSSPSGSFSNR